jgi:hypothetical protein
MSSATRVDMNATRNLIGGLQVVNEGDGPTDHLSPRQRELDRLWRYYRCTNYEGRKYDWDGRENLDHLEHESFAMQGTTPPGYYDAGGATTPLKFRKPTAPYYLGRVIPDRFTGMLFGRKRRPRVTVDDPKTEDWLLGFAQATRFWSQWIKARTFGGGMGTTCVGFAFRKGRPSVEVHDPRWCFPEFSDRATHELRKLEKRYQYPDEVKNGDGEWETKWFWYRRVIDAETDTVWPRVPVEGNQEPVWTQYPSNKVTHGFGEVPAVWIQNQPVDDDIDGDPDCHGIYEQIEEIDALWSQAGRGTKANCFGCETQFVTEHGVRSFDQFRHGDEVVVLTHEGTWKRAKVLSYGNQTLVTVTMQRGTRGRPVAVRVTRDHCWLLEDGEDSTNLQVGDRLLAAPRMFSEFDYDYASVEEQAAWRLGFAWGDGSQAGAGIRIRLCGEKRRFAARFKRAGCHVRYPAWAGGDASVRIPNAQKVLPDEGVPLNMLRAFVRGYVDADGTVGAHGSGRWKRIQATGTVSIEFIRWAFPAVGLYITAEAPVTGSTTYGPRSAETVRFELNENASRHGNSAWRVTAIDADGPVETVWCLSVADDRSFVLPFGVATRNCDPTLEINSNLEFEEGLRKGSENAIQVEMGGKVGYLEMNGAGIEKAVTIAEKLEEKPLTVARCVLDRNEGGTARSPDEVEHNYSAMIDQADILREQYGELGIQRLLEKVLRAARKMMVGSIEPGLRVVGQPEPNPKVVRQTIKLPKRKQVIDEAEGTFEYVERELGDGEQVELVWPDYFTPSSAEIAAVVDAAGKAKTMYGILDLQHAVGAVASYFHVENVAALVKKLQDDAAAQQQAQQAMMGGYPPAGTY